MWLDQVEGKDWDFGKSGCVKTLSSCREFDFEIPPWLSSVEAGVEGGINWKEISVCEFKSMMLQNQECPTLLS